MGIVLQSFSKMMVLINFQINKEYITKNLCVQKEVEDNCCKGSCQLKKQLDEEAKKEQSPASNIKDVNEFQIFCQNNFNFHFIPHLILETDFVPYTNTKETTSSFSIFHPPKSLA